MEGDKCNLHPKEQIWLICREIGCNLQPLCVKCIPNHFKHTIVNIDSADIEQELKEEIDLKGKFKKVEEKKEKIPRIEEKKEKTPKRENEHIFQGIISASYDQSLILWDKEYKQKSSHKGNSKYSK